MWLTQFVCAPQFFKTPSGLCGHTVFLVNMTISILDFIYRRVFLFKTAFQMLDFFQNPEVEPIHLGPRNSITWVAG
jgi:hypothetical protein